MRKFIITSELRDITDRWINEHREDAISYSKMQELLNEKALKYAQEYADSKWVSVDERLPDEGENVIVFDGKRQTVICNASLNEDKYFESAWGNFFNVTHWQPLPNPPKTIRQ